MPKLKSLKPAIDPKFLEFLNKDFLVDVSLVADGFMMSCHGNVLAAASTYFEEILGMIKSRPNCDRVIVLSEVPSNLLGSIVEFIYTGSVTVEEKNIQQLQKIFKQLRLESIKADDETEFKGFEDTRKFAFLEQLELTGRDLKKTESTIALEQETSSYPPLRRRFPTILRRMTSQRRVTIDSVVKGQRARTFMEMFPINCPFCMKKAKNQKHRNEHVKYCIKNPDRVISTCPLCDKSFCDPYYVRKHLIHVHSIFK